jgi:hypothetical protein
VHSVRRVPPKVARWIPTALAWIIVAVVLIGLEAANGPGKTSKQCAANTPQSVSGEKVKVDLGETQKLEHEIGRERSGYDVAVLNVGTRDDATLPGKGASLSGEIVGALSPVNGEGDGLIEDAIVRVGVSGGNELVVKSCINTSSVDAGRYAGKALVKGDEIVQFTVPVTATVKRSGYVGWAVVATLAAVLGFILRALANVGQLVEPPPNTKRKKTTRSLNSGWNAYLRHWSYLGGLAFAAIGAGGAWLATYMTQDTWGANLEADLPKLLGAAFAGAVGGMTFTDLASTFSDRGKE